MNDSRPAPSSYGPAALRALLSTCDPRQLGVMHLALIGLALVTGTAYALLVRALPEEMFEQRLHMLRAHGVVMVFLCVVPAIPATLGNFMLPGLLGVRDMALPRLNRAALHAHVLGFALVIAALATRGTAPGWLFFDASNSVSVSSSVLWLAGAVAVLAVSSALRAVSMLVTIHASRVQATAPQRLTPLAWGLYASSLLQALIAPLCVITMVLLVGERTLALGLLDPRLGGDTLLFSHLIWLYLHPALASALLAGMGVIGELLSTYSGRSVPAWTAKELVALALLSLLGWGQHLYTSGASEVAAFYFGLDAALFQLPLLFVLMSWVASLRGGSIRFEAPMLYALAFIVLFGIAAPAGIVLALPASASYLGSTVFATGQLHYVAVGGTLCALLGGLHHAWHGITGRHYDETLARAFAGCLFLGTNLAFLPMLIMGAQGMPRPMQTDFGASFGPFQIACSLGCGLLVVGLVGGGGVLVASLWKGKANAGALAESM